MAEPVDHFTDTMDDAGGRIDRESLANRLTADGETRAKGGHQKTDQLWPAKILHILQQLRRNGCGSGTGNEGPGACT